MMITLYRFDQENQIVIESNPIRRVLVGGNLFCKKACRDGIKSAIANHGGPMAIEFKSIIMGTRLRLAFIFGVDGPVNVKHFADTIADQVVDALKLKSLQLSAA